MIELRGIIAAYGQTPVLDLEHLAFSMRAISALTGPNGSGKSTLLMILAGLITPRQGKVLLNGRDITGRPVREIGIVLQRPVLFAGTVKSNVEYGLKCHGLPPLERKNRVHEALAMTGLMSLAGRNRRQLSGGEIQRVALARSLALNPEVLLLDVTVYASG